MQFVMMPGGGKAHITAQLDAAQLYLNKVLVTAKDQADPEKTNQRNYVAALKKVFTDLGEFVNENFKTGLTWKKDGKDLA